MMDPRMSYYPIFLDLSAKDILVAGAGQVGRRKIDSLLACSPRGITVIDPSLDEETSLRLSGQGPVVCLARAFATEDILGKHMVFAATNNREVNALIADICQSRGILCNTADAPESSSFIVPAHFNSGGITVAVSTHGQSPALARRLRRDLEAWVGKRYTPLLLLLGRLRPLLLELGLPTGDNTFLFRSLAQSPLADLLEQKNLEAAHLLLQGLLPEQLHPRIRELTHGI